MSPLPSKSRHRDPKPSPLVMVSAIHRLLGDDTVLIVPSTVSVALRLGTPEADLDAYRQRALSVICIAGLAGLPQVSPEP